MSKMSKTEIRCTLLENIKAMEKIMKVGVYKKSFFVSLNLLKELNI